MINKPKYNIEGSINLALKSGKTYEFGLWYPAHFKALISIEEDINLAKNITEWLNKRGLKSHEIADIKININYS